MHKANQIIYNKILKAAKREALIQLLKLSKGSECKKIVETEINKQDCLTDLDLALEGAGLFE